MSLELRQFIYGSGDRSLSDVDITENPGVQKGDNDKRVKREYGTIRAVNESDTQEFSRKISHLDVKDSSNENANNSGRKSNDNVGNSEKKKRKRKYESRGETDEPVWVGSQASFNRNDANGSSEMSSGIHGNGPVDSPVDSPVDGPLNNNKDTEGRVRRVSRERDILTSNWKYRKVDVRQETDWGGSLFHAVQRFRLHRIPKQRTTIVDHENKITCADVKKEMSVEMDEEEKKPTLAPDENDFLSRIFNNSLREQNTLSKDQQQNGAREDNYYFWDSGHTSPNDMQPIINSYYQQLFQFLTHGTHTTKPTEQGLDDTGCSNMLIHDPDNSITTSVKTSLKAPPPRFNYDRNPHTQWRDFEFFPFQNDKQSTSNQNNPSFFTLHHSIFTRVAFCHLMAALFPSSRAETQHQQYTNNKILRIFWEYDLSPHWKDLVLRQARILFQKFQAENHAQIISNDTSFAYIRGDMPPSPILPIASTNLLFGPADRNAIMDHSAVSDQGMVLFTISVFISGKLSALQELRHDSWEQAGSDQTILTFLTELVKLAETEESRVRILRRIVGEYSRPERVPVVAIYDAILLYVSVMANVPLQVDFFKDGDDTALAEAYKQIFELLDSRVNQMRFQPFPRLHILHGISRLANVLPAEGIDILSRAFGEENSNYRTPLDAMRTLLHYIEQNELLDGSDKQSAVPVYELEYELFRSSLSFQSAVKADPTEPFYQAWHIASLAACLLLCSGNCIDGTARGFPSSKGKHRDDEFLAHEVRFKLDKFCDIRKQVANAFSLLLDLAYQRKGCRSHMVVMSFLEWKQVIGLMAGSNLLQNETLQSIRNLHGFHSYEWALADHSPMAREYLMRTNVARSKRLNVLALSLENDPENISNWRSFVDQISPLSQAKVHSSPMLSTNDADWMKEREHWINDVLAVSLPNVSISREEADSVLKEATTILRECNREEPSSFSVATHLNKDLSETEEGSLEWLHSILEMGSTDATNTETPPTLDERKRVFNDDFPQSLADVLSRERVDLQHPQGFRLQLDIPNSNSLEVLCYKAFIADHMFGKSGLKIIDRVIQYLVTQSWERTISSFQIDRPEWKCLVWLQRKGLDVVATVARLTSESGATGEFVGSSDVLDKFKENAIIIPTSHMLSRSERYPEAMRLAVKEGLELFGFHLQKIQRHYQTVFQEHHRQKAVFCYLDMIRTGEIKPHKDDPSRATRTNAEISARQSISAETQAASKESHRDNEMQDSVFGDLSTRSNVVESAQKSAATSIIVPKLGEDEIAALQQAERTKLRRRKAAEFPEEMQFAVKEGLEMFGFDFKKIRLHYSSIFQSHHHSKAEGCYRFMIRTGDIKRHPDDSRSPAHFPEALRLAVKEGLEKFGFDLAKIQSHYSVFQGYHQTKALYCYRYMHMNGEIPRHPDDPGTWQERQLLNKARKKR